MDESLGIRGIGLRQVAHVRIPDGLGIVDEVVDIAHIELRQARHALAVGQDAIGHAENNGGRADDVDVDRLKIGGGQTLDLGLNTRVRMFCSF